MFTRRDHFSDASQSNAETQIDLNTRLGNAILESAQRFLDLNMHACQVSLQEIDRTLMASLSARSPQECSSLMLAHAQNVSRRAIAYGYHTAGIVAGTQSELMDLLGSQISETSNEAIALAADVSRNAPMGLNRVSNFMRIVFDHANAGYEQVTEISRQFLDALENNLIAAANQFARAA